RALADAEQHADREQEIAEERLEEEQAMAARVERGLAGRAAQPRRHRHGRDGEAHAGEEEDRKDDHQRLREADVRADDGHRRGQAEVGEAEARPRGAAHAVAGRCEKAASSGRQRSLRASKKLATTTPTATTAMMIVATALTLGFRPSRAREKMTSGIVVAPGPERNADSTTSSSESVKVSRNADSSA